MSSIAALIADLVAAGTPPELVGRVAAALADREPVVVVQKDEAAERRRAADRERKARVRGLPQTSAESADMSPDGPPSPPAPPLPPLNPPDAPMSARARLDEIEEKCRKAAGYEREPSPGLCSLAPILNLMDQGISLEADILPAIKAALPRMRRPARSWDYFREPILEWHAKRTAPVVVPMVARAPPGDPQLQAQRDLMARLDEKYAKAKAIAQ